MGKKNANNEGSLYQRKDGRWVAAYTASGKQKYLYASTREEAAKKLRDTLSRMDRGEYIEPSAVTVEQWLNIWLREYAAPSVRASTYGAHEGIVRQHLIPVLGKHRLQALRPEHIQAFSNQQDKEGYAPATVKRQLATLKVALKQAVENQLLFRNPSSAVRLPKQEQKEIEFLTAEEQQALLAVLPMTTQGRALRFILGTGLRVAELCGLCWGDVSGDGFHVNQVTYLVKRGGAYERVTNPPKTKAGKRYIPINEKLRVILDEQRKGQRLERMKVGVAWEGEEPGKGMQWVFASTMGTPADRNNLARCLRGCLKEAGLKTRGVHALRHTFATNWTQVSSDYRTLSEIMGHTNVAFTIQRYVHSDKDMKKKGMDFMASLL